MRVHTVDEFDEIVMPEVDDDAAREKPITAWPLRMFILPIHIEQLAGLPIATDPEILSGELVFSGTRVPVAALLDKIEVGLTLEEFLDNFPTVTREQATQVLKFALHQ